MRLKALKEFINELMAKKEAYDWKCMQAAQPLATLEKFFFIHLTEKYGLRTLVASQAEQTIDSVKHLMNEDALVLFFAKALKNLCPTGYLGSMKSREDEVIQILTTILQEKYRTHAELSRTLDLLKENKVQLSHNAWVRCTKILFKRQSNRCDRDFL